MVEVLLYLIPMVDSFKVTNDHQLIVFIRTVRLAKTVHHEKGWWLKETIKLGVCTSQGLRSRERAVNKETLFEIARFRFGSLESRIWSALRYSIILYFGFI